MTQIMKIMPDSYASNVDWISVDVHLKYRRYLFRCTFDLKIVSNKEWLNTLLNTPEYQKVNKTPIAALSEFFEKAMSESSDKSEKHEPLFEIQKSSGRSLALSNC
ncbi:hypothetical protein F8M41_008689 [Gigaspora margarita]|uniref:Uncharacterized protein n=1 Tax=Gigaspora margarita TaxID=4874 RepID=A0A8H4A3L0_GIGMA|nr:hypothetical protein F8M41_008689 [Gigaspora margarita]